MMTVTGQSSLDSLRAHLTSIEGEGKDVRAGAGPGGEGGGTRPMDLEQQVKVLQGELDELDELLVFFCFFAAGAS